MSHSSWCAFTRLESAAAAVAAVVCCYTAVVAGVVRHRVPDGKIIAG